jgi:hypothetical protein
LTGGFGETAPTIGCAPGELTAREADDEPDDNAGDNAGDEPDDNAGDNAGDEPGKNAGDDAGDETDEAGGELAVREAGGFSAATLTPFSGSDAHMDDED